MYYHSIPPQYFFPFWGVVAPLLVVLILWELFWKGLALWHSARNKQVIWFVVFLLVHTAGILEIIYLVWFRSDKDTLTLFDKPKTAPATGSSSVPGQKQVE